MLVHRQSVLFSICAAMCLIGFIYSIAILPIRNKIESLEKYSTVYELMKHNNGYTEVYENSTSNKPNIMVRLNGNNKLYANTSLDIVRLYLLFEQAKIQTVAYFIAHSLLVILIIVVMVCRV